MAELVTMRWGDHEFSISRGTFNNFQRSTAWRIDKPEPMTGLGQPRARGKASDEITLDGVVLPGFTGDQQSVQRFRDAGDAGKAQLLVDGEGNVFGSWFLERLSESRDVHTTTGIPRKMTWSLTLTAEPEESA